MSLQHDLTVVPCRTKHGNALQTSTGLSPIPGRRSSYYRQPHSEILTPVRPSNSYKLQRPPCRPFTMVQNSPHEVIGVRVPRQTISEPVERHRETAPTEIEELPRMMNHIYSTNSPGPRLAGATSKRRPKDTQNIVSSEGSRAKVVIGGQLKRNLSELTRRVPATRATFDTVECTIEQLIADDELQEALAADWREIRNVSRHTNHAIDISPTIPFRILKTNCATRVPWLFGDIARSKVPKFLS